MPKVTTYLPQEPSDVKGYEILETVGDKAKDTPFHVVSMIEDEDVAAYMDGMSEEDIRNHARKSVIIAMAGELRAEVLSSLGFQVSRAQTVKKSSVKEALDARVEKGTLSTEARDAILAEMGIKADN